MEGASLRRLRLSNFKLNCLLDITKAINDNLPTDELLNKFENILKNDLNIGKVLVFSFNKEWEYVLASGLSDEIISQIKVERDLIEFTGITTISTTLDTAISRFDVIIPVYHKDNALAYVLIGDIDEERDGISPTIKHLHFIQTLTNIIIVAIENKRLYNEHLKQEALRKELELASKMQNMLIPDPASLPVTKDYQVVAYYNPHFEVGGDYYDFIQLNENEFGFCIADVSGKGISAALLMSNFQAIIRALFTAKIKLKDLIYRLNERVMANAKGEKFITLFIGRYNCKTKQLQYINAGHNPPILYNTNTRKIKYLKDGCIGLGMFNEIEKIKKGNIRITDVTKLLCYTDGLVEVENENSIEFGTEELANTISEDGKIDVVINKVIHKLKDHKGKKEYFDDISIIGIEFY